MINNNKYLAKRSVENAVEKWPGRGRATCEAHQQDMKSPLSHGVRALQMPTRRSLRDKF